MLLPLEPDMDVAPDPVVDVPVLPATGALGTTAALLGAVLPMEVAGELAPPSGVTLGIAIGAVGRAPRRLAAPLPGERLLLARHRRMNPLLFCSLT
jgi:hypothetical protein